MPQRQRIAGIALAGFAIGAALTLTDAGPHTAAISGSGLTWYIAVRVSTLTCGLVLAAVIVRKWLDSVFGQILSTMNAIAGQQRRVFKETEQRLVREEAKARSATAAAASWGRQLADAHSELDELRVDFDELATDYNHVVVCFIQQGAALFTRRPPSFIPSTSNPPATCTPLRRAGRGGGAASPRTRDTADTT